MLEYRAQTGEIVLFDEWCDDEFDNGIEGGGIWVTVCEKCLKKYKKALRKHVSGVGSGSCSVKSCEDWEDNGEVSRYYVDFKRSEVLIRKW